MFSATHHIRIRLPAYAHRVLKNYKQFYRNVQKHLAVLFTVLFIAALRYYHHCTNNVSQI